MKLAAQLFTVRKFTQNEEDLYSSLKKLKEIGYNAVQISGCAYNAEKLKKELNELELSVCATHTPVETIINNTEAVINDHKILKAEYVGIGYFKGESLKDYELFLNSLKEPSKKIRDAGLKLLYHNHDHEFKKFDGITVYDFLAENTSSELFGFLADLYWIQYAGYNPIEILEKYKYRIEMVHLKDMRYHENPKNKFSEIFEGNMNYIDIINKCYDIGIKWAAVEQDSCDGDPFDSLKISLNNIKSLVNKDLYCGG